MSTKKSELDAAAHQKVYDLIKKVRESKTVKLQPSKFLRTEITALDGTVVPFSPRYYQVQGIFHFLSINRMVLGDGTGLGKTLSSIAAMCYLWEKDPTYKVIVICPKSAIRQWAAEVEKFAHGVTTFVSMGAPKQREKVCREWAAFQGPSILLTNYHGLVKDWDACMSKEEVPEGAPVGTVTRTSKGLLDELTSNAPNLLTVYDECFTHHTPIILADGTTELIGKIVSKKMPVEVATWNWEKGVVEPKKVVNWFRKSLQLKTAGEVLKIQTRYSGTVNVTKSHDFYRVNGTKVPAYALKPGTELACLTHTSPSHDQEQVILGGLLGDAGLIHRQRHTWGVSFCQSVKQEGYIDFKRAALTSLGVSDKSYYKTEFQTKEGQGMVRFRLNANPCLTSMLLGCGFDGMQTKVRKTAPKDDGNFGGKRITAEFLDRIGPLALAVWYGDDGSIQEHTMSDGTVTRVITLNTQGFNREENEILAGYLRWKWGVMAKVSFTYNKKRDSEYWCLYLDRYATERFLALLPGSLPGVEYKFPYHKVLRVVDLDLTPKSTIIKDEVVSSEVTTPYKGKPRLKTPYVFDLEVEDNHNYFANGILVSNCTAFKNPGTKTAQVCRFLSDKSKRVWGLTATLLKNNLMEGFGIYQVIRPGTFTSKNAFLNSYCEVELQAIKGGGKIPIVRGYKNLDHFRKTIDPYFYGRAKHQVSSELPALTTKEVVCEMSKQEEAKYVEALTGLLEVAGQQKDYRETKALTSLIYLQEVCDSIGLIDDTFEGRSAKESGLVDLLQDDLEDEKVIVYTRYEKMVTRLQAILKAEKIPSVRITGKESDKERKKAQDAFQDPKSKIRVVFITDAGSEAINLQAAGALVFFDAPWSWGTYLQIIGRMIRIGSMHANVYAIHLVAERPGRKGKERETLDHKVLKQLRKKKSIIDQVLGESAQGALRFERGEDMMADLVRSLLEEES